MSLTGNIFLIYRAYSLFYFPCPIPLPRPLPLRPPLPPMPTPTSPYPTHPPSQCLRHSTSFHFSPLCFIISVSLFAVAVLVGLGEKIIFIALLYDGPVFNSWIGLFLCLKKNDAWIHENVFGQCSKSRQQGGDFLTWRQLHLIWYVFLFIILNERQERICCKCFSFILLNALIWPFVVGIDWA